MKLWLCAATSGASLWRIVKTAGLLSAISCLCAACDSPSITRYAYSPDRHGERMLGSIDFTADDYDDASNLHVYKLRKGYGVKAHLHQDKNERSDLVVSRGGEFGWFAGFQWKFSF